MSSLKVGSVVTWTQSWAHRPSEQLVGMVTGINHAAECATVHVEGRAGIYTPRLSVLARAESAVVDQLAELPMDDSVRESAIADLLRSAGCHQ